MAVAELRLALLRPRRWWRRAHWRLLEPFTLAGVRVPAGVVSDGTTSPRLLWPLFPPIDDAAPAAVLHDYLLQREPRRRADYLFEVALEQLGVARWRRWVMVAAVRVAGMRLVNSLCQPAQVVTQQ